MAGIYVHVPFCKSKCRYCDFVSYPEKIGLAESYMTCLFHEMAMRGAELKDCDFDTLYIGGGTPSVIDESYIAMLVVAAKKYFKLKKNAEITIEINPGTLSQSKVEMYKKCGINRFSVGLQSASDELLRDIGRCHTAKDFVKCAKLLKGENFNADVMIGLRGQTLQDIKDTIVLAHNCGAEHISIYALTPEEGTPIYTDYLNGELPDGDEVAEMYAFGAKILNGLGYIRYEVSNFSKKGRESRHNLNYWKRGEYIGLGVSASSHIKGVRFTNTYNLDEYFKCVLSNAFPVVDREEVDKRGAMQETVMLALRTCEGLDINKFNSVFSCDFLKEYASALEKNKSFLVISDGVLKIKEEYLYVQNSIICDFLD